MTRRPQLLSLLVLLWTLSACATGPTRVALFDGATLQGWVEDVPAQDEAEATGAPAPAPSFVVENGILVSRGTPGGHLVTAGVYSDYRLHVEWRWPAKPGNCGVLVHASKPRRLYKMFPQSIEVQLHSGNAGDFWCIGEDIVVPDMETRRKPRDKWGVEEGQARRILNLTDDSEKPAGEWNAMTIECRGDTITVWVNGDLVNAGSACTAREGRIAIQAEGARCEFRRLALERL